MNNPQPYAVLEDVTPRMAREWLARNENNRHIREAKVGIYAAEMSSGSWLVTGETVKIDRDGGLIDGQHRLLGVVKADRPVRMFVVRDLDPNAQMVIDTGAKRTPGDALKFAGVEHNTKAVAAVAKIVILWDEGALKRSGASAGREVTNTEVVEWAKTHANQAQEFFNLSGRIDNHGKGFPTVSRSVLAASLFIISRGAAEEAALFAADMANLSMYGKGDPLHALYTRLNVAKTSREVLRVPGQLFCYFRTWNARVDGEPLYQLKIGRAGGRGTGVITVPTPKRPAADVRAVS